MTHPALALGHVAVVTGAAQGIGLAIAQALAERGLNLVLLDRDPDALMRASEVLLANYGLIAVETHVIDVADATAMTSLANEVLADFDAVHVLVNNAGVTAPAGPFDDLATWHRNLNINLFGVLNGHAAYVPAMISSGQPGLVVNVGSKEGITTPPGNAAYAVAKAAVKVLTEQLAHELRQSSGARVTSHLLIPGYTHTPMNFPGMTDSSKKPFAPWTAGQVAAAMLKGVDEGLFYIICPDNEVSSDLDAKRIAWAALDMIERRPALSRWHKDHAAKFDEFVALDRAGSSNKIRSALYGSRWFEVEGLK